MAQSYDGNVLSGEQLLNADIYIFMRCIINWLMLNTNMYILFIHVYVC